MNTQFPPVRSPSFPARGTSSQKDRIEASLARVEGKLDILLEALAADGDQDEPPGMTLDGEPAGEARPEGELL
ncbi:hypothetical protein [Bordetella bronchiseptica]|uniref:hypothetical protein n=1 Tax=Bordetella bronchiseptica TaxID=518 RepID=UPI0012384CC2|nr:hypothetical protein [Bordetella bronchiseptica]QET71437.1 hypothetical protein FOB42_14450 [Bordetella bronchiseptica]